jgi:hypothetical protein
MNCPKCSRTVFKSFDDDYIVCCHCGTLSELPGKQNYPCRDIKPVKNTNHTRLEYSETIKACIVKNIDEITALRKARVGWMTIFSTLSLIGSHSVVSKYYRNTTAGEAVKNPITDKRAQYINYGLKKRQSKQEVYA